MSNFSSQSRRSGFSLIEVAIALAIFVFGALAIVQIFPPALGVIRNNESRVTATQLGETLLARSAGKTSSVPDAIYEGDALGGWNPAIATNGKDIALVGTSSKNQSLPASPLPADFDNSALSRFRYIRGEKHIVQAGIDPDDTIVTTPQPFVILNHPSTTDVRIFEEITLNGVQISTRGVVDFSDATLLDGTTFTPAAGTGLGDPTYYVSYRWNEGGNIKGVIDEPIKLKTGFANDWRVAQGYIDSTERVLAGNVAVRYRRLLNPSTSVTAPAGVVARNIAGFTPGRTLSFDYQVADWRIMADESGPDVTGLVTLPIHNIDQAYPPNATLTYVNGGASYFKRVLAPPITPNGYKQGQIFYTNAVGRTIPRARTFYRALDGWAQQLSVAAKSYVPYYTDANFTLASPPNTRPIDILPREQWREYYWSSASPRSLFFRASEAGKSVSVSFVDNSGAVVNGAVLTIDDDLIPTPNTGFSGQRVAEARIVNTAGVEVDARSIISIQGLSTQARTAWQNGDRYTQVIVPGYRTLMP